MQSTNVGKCIEKHILPIVFLELAVIAAAASLIGIGLIKAYSGGPPELVAQGILLCRIGGGLIGGLLITEGALGAYHFDQEAKKLQKALDSLKKL